MSSPTVIPDSDEEEREEALVSTLRGEALREYWRPSRQFDATFERQQSLLASDASHPTRMQPPPSFPSPARDSSASDSSLPSPRRLVLAHRPVAGPSRPRVRHETSPLPIARIARPPSPAPSSSSSESEADNPPSEPPLGQAVNESNGRRSLRTRTVAQLKPYSIENLKYTKTLLKNGWQGAVVAAPKAVDLSTDELLRKKELARAKPKDDLEGWLELEDGNPVARHLDDQGQAARSSDDDSSVDGETLLAKEDRRRRRLDREVASALGIRDKGKEKVRYVRTEVEGRHAPAGRGAGTSKRVRADRQAEDEDLLFFERIPKAVRANAAVERSKKQNRSKRTYSSDSERQTRAEDHRRQRRKDGRDDRAGSEPTSSQPDRLDRPSSRNRKRKAANGPLVAVVPGRGLPAAGPVHGHRQRLPGVRDDDILALSLAYSSPRSAVYASDNDSGAESCSSASSDEIAPVDESKAQGFDLNRKRKKALGAMMPAVFMRKAQADLRLMEREKEDGVLSDFSENSGDEEAQQRERERRNLARRKMGTAARQARAARGEAFTDESASEGDDVVLDDDHEEENAVASWLHSFAPKRRPGRGQDQDLIDCILRKSQPAASAKVTRPNQKRKRKHRDTPVDSRIDEEPATHIAPAETHQGRGSVHRDRPARLPSYALDQDNVLFNCAELPDVAGAGVEIWARFSRFSVDFDLEPVPSGRTFSHTSFLRAGFVKDLVRLPIVQGRPEHDAVDVLDLAFSSSMTADDLQARLPQLCDALYSFVADQHADEMRSMALNVDRALRLVYASSVRQPAGTSRWARLQLARLIDRIDALESRHARTFETMAILAWHKFALDVHLSVVQDDDDQDFSDSLRQVVRLLLKIGLSSTAQAIRNMTRSNEACEDVSAQIWVGIISLAALKEGRIADLLSQESLWKVVYDEVLASIPTRLHDGPVCGEVLCYAAMVLTALSQFDESGTATDCPRFRAQYWPFVVYSFDKVVPQSLGKTDATVSNTALARRDRYLITLFGKIMTLVQRWNWKIDVRSDVILTKMFDVLNARRFTNLSIETSVDFPDFVKRLSADVDADFEATVQYDRDSDTVVIMFLKLVLGTFRSTQFATAEDRKRTMTRVLLRLTPSNAKPWTRDAIELRRRDENGSSALVNRYSLAMTLALVDPSSSSTRIEQARRLLSFGDVDDDARRTTLRAIWTMLSLARSYASSAGPGPSASIALGPVLEWLASVTDTLRTEYVQIQKERRDALRSERDTWALKAKGAAMGGSSKRKNDALWCRAVLLTMVLRAVEDVCQQGQDAFPVAELMHPAWTDKILESPVALDPMIGSEVLRFVNSYLDLRESFIARRQVDRTESQELFDMMDGEDEAFTKADRSFAESRVKDGGLVGALFKLVSGVFAYSAASSNTSSAANGWLPMIQDKFAYAQQAVECWARCIEILVKHELADWTGYLEYGVHSWKRVSDPVGRRQVGLLLAVQIARRVDLSGATLRYATLVKDLVEVWFQAVCSRRLTNEHVELTDRLARLTCVRLVDSSLLQDVLDQDDDQQQQRENKVQLNEFRKRRLEIVRDALDRAGSLIVGSSTSALARLDIRTKSDVLNQVRSMVVSMNDELNAIVVVGSDVRTIEQKRNYATFAGQVVDCLKGGKLKETVKTMPMVASLEQTIQSVS